MNLMFINLSFLSALSFQCYVPTVTTQLPSNVCEYSASWHEWQLAQQECIYLLNRSQEETKSLQGHWEFRLIPRVVIKQSATQEIKPSGLKCTRPGGISKKVRTIYFMIAQKKASPLTYSHLTDA